MPEVGVSYNADTGELIVGDVTMELPNRFQRIMLGEQSPPGGWGNPSQWDGRATSWLRNVLGRNDISVHVFSITPSPPRVAILMGEPNPPANWWAS